MRAACLSAAYLREIRNGQVTSAEMSTVRDSDDLDARIAAALANTRQTLVKTKSAVATLAARVDEVGQRRELE